MSRFGEMRGEQALFMTGEATWTCRGDQLFILQLCPPGAGQSRLARRLTTILPDLTLAEAIDTPRIHRVAGRTGRRPAVVTIRPCRDPDQRLAEVGLIGGGQVPMPCEVSLAHHGVLCLDELPECRRHGLEGLRQPLGESVKSVI
jgi:magnesium chelatase family protein